MSVTYRLSGSAFRICRASYRSVPRPRDRRPAVRVAILQSPSEPGTSETKAATIPDNGADIIAFHAPIPMERLRRTLPALPS